MKIGILGGTFDPVHEGHLALARAARDKLKLDKVVFVPAFQHPFAEKREQGASTKDRLEMARLAVQSEPKFEVSDCELKRKGVSYTVDTLREFRKEFPAPHELFFITGGDWGKNLSKWKEIDVVFQLAHFVVARRPGFDTSTLPRQVQLLDFVPLDISSSAIRQEMKQDGRARSWVPAPVFEYITQHNLYR